LHQAVVVNGGVLIIGGTSKAQIDFGGNFKPILKHKSQVGNLPDTVWFFDANSLEFKAVGEILPPRADATAVLLSNGKVLVLGGQTEGPLRSTDINVGTFVDGTRWTWPKQSATLKVARKGAAAVPVENQILVVGGDEQSAVEVLTINSDTITSTLWEGSTIPSVTGHTLTRLLNENLILLAGGVPPMLGVGPIDSTFSFQWSNGSFSLEGQPGNMASERAYHVAMRLEDGRVVLAGGLKAGAGAVFAETKTVEKWTNLTTTEILPDQTLAVGPIGIAAALAPDGSVLLAGGLSMTNGTATLVSRAQLLSP
jgi:hypothetical protein